MLVPKTAVKENNFPPTRENEVRLARQVFAEFEREILRERVCAGLAHTLQQGKRLGRPPSVLHKAVEARKLHQQGSSKSEIARKLEIGRTSVRRLLAQKQS